MGHQRKSPNLERRGHLFYWRPRLPRRLKALTGKSRLSIALGVYDFKKACYLADRCSLMLREWEMTPGPLDSRAGRMEQIFRDELASMAGRLEDLAFVARRHGRNDLHIDTDIELSVGWAHRVLEIFGPARTLAFDEQCPARSFLKESGLSDGQIRDVAIQFELEAPVCRSTAFDLEAQRRLVAFGLEDTIPNRERAKMQILRARADALLDTASRAAINPSAAMPAPVAPIPETPSDPVPVTQPPARPPSPTPDTPLSIETAPTMPASVAPVPTSLPAAVPLPASTLPRSIPVPMAKPDAAVADFHREAKACVANQSSWSVSSQNNFFAMIQLFSMILQEDGVEYTSQITQMQIAHFRAFLNQIPTRYGQSSRLRSMNPKQLRGAGEALEQEQADAGSKGRKVGLTATTIRKHLFNLKIFLQHIKSTGYAIDALDINSLTPKKPSKAATRAKQAKPAPSEIEPLFKTPFHLGSASAEDHGKIPGLQVFHGAAYFAPIFLVYLGARRIEICGLATADVDIVAGTPQIEIKPNDNRGMKTPQSRRALPVPDEALRLGFMDYVAEIRRIGEKRLFPELYSPFKEKQDPGDRFYKEFVPAVRKVFGEEHPVWDRVIHALRHGFSNTARLSNISEIDIDDISGRIGDTETKSRYTNPATVEYLQEKLRSAYKELPTRHLEPSPIKLLPWVSELRPPPWSLKKSPESETGAKKFAAYKTALKNSRKRN